MEIVSRFNEYQQKKLGRYQLPRPTATYGVLNQGRHWQNYPESLERLVAYTITDVPLSPLDDHVTYDFAYIRSHGAGRRSWFNYEYSEEQLQEQIPRVDGVDERTERIPNFSYVQTASRASFYQERKIAPEGLAAWGPITDLPVEKLLLTFANAESIEIAQSISDENFSFRDESTRVLAAYIGVTTVYVNLEERIIVHRCPTWAESSLEQKFCPHIVKMFLSINPERARTALAQIYSNLNSWKFQSRLAVESPK